MNLAMAKKLGKAPLESLWITQYSLFTSLQAEEALENAKKQATANPTPSSSNLLSKGSNEAEARSAGFTKGALVLNSGAGQAAAKGAAGPAAMLSFCEPSNNF